MPSLVQQDSFYILGPLQKRLMKPSDDFTKYYRGVSSTRSTEASSGTVEIKGTFISLSMNQVSPLSVVPFQHHDQKSILSLHYRSSNSIDHLHSKRDSAYSSFSTSSSIPEYLASPSFNPERSYSLETVSPRGGGSGDMQLADMRYVRTVYDANQEHELGSISNTLRGSTEGARMGRDLQGNISVPQMISK